MTRLLRDFRRALFAVAFIVTVETLLLIARAGLATFVVYALALVAFYAVGDATGSAREKQRQRVRNYYRRGNYERQAPRGD